MHGYINLYTVTLSVSNSIFGPLATIVLLIAAGILALGVELFIIPGFGLVGILGIAAILGGMITSWIEFGPVIGMITVVITSVLTAIMAVMMLRSRFVKKRLVLDTQLESGGGTESQDFVFLLGKQGTTHTMLRPAGIALIEGQRVDVVSQGGYLEKGMQIKVIAVDGPRIVVAKVD